MVSYSNLIRNLAYLHDAKCLEVVWDCTGTKRRVMRIVVIVDQDAGFPAWDGKTLVITLSGVAVAHFTGWGNLIGEEYIDNWEQGISESLEKYCKVLESKGISFPPLQFVVSFSSGSVLEVICSDISIQEHK